MSKNGLASDGTSGNRVETALIVDCGAGSAMDMLQHSAGKSGLSGTPLRRTTAKDVSTLNVYKNTNQETRPYPRFLVVKRKEGDLTKVNPFIIERRLYGLIGSSKNVRKIKDGLLVETVSAAQSKRLLDVDMLADFSVDVIPHQNLNTSRGVIYCPDLLNCSEDEVLEGLKDQGIVAVKRIKTKKDGNLIDTPNHILTFNTPVLPKRIKAAFYSLPVRLYIPPPMRCFKCQKFGHTSSRCNEEQISICGKSPHTGSPCSDPLICVNCKGPHSARSRNCPVYKQEAAIQEVKTKENLPYNEARKKVAISTPTPNVSYAGAVTSTPKIDYTPLINQLIPKTIDAISIIIKQDLPTRGVTVSQEKRKRDQSPEHPSLASGDETSFSSVAAEARKKSKKKPGWSKGKPRKISD